MTDEYMQSETPPVVPTLPPLEPPAPDNLPEFEPPPFEPPIPDVPWPGMADLSGGIQILPASRPANMTPLPPPMPPALAPPRPDDLPPLDQPYAGPPQVNELHGHFRTWIGRVTKTYYDVEGGNAVDGMANAVEVERVDIIWNATTNEPVGTTAAHAASEPTPTTVMAFPWPLGYDQPKYHVQTGEYVIVYTSDDGRHFYSADNEPFIGTVIDWPIRYLDQYVSDSERFNDGVGNWTIAVQRQMLVTDPDMVINPS